MAPRQPRVVAELGRPETPDETASRKAEASRVYRSSQTTRNLIAALLVTIAIVAVIVLGVPRGTPPPRDPIDVAATAESIGVAEGHTAIAPDLPAADWVVNRAAVEGDGSVRAWTIVYAPADEDIPGFLRVAQAFDADDGWAARILSGSAPTGTQSIGGVTWDRYDLDASRTGNITVALGATAGDDTILIYGTAADPLLEDMAAAVADEVLALRKDAE
ncbi:DUF4245 family protein [Microbacterium sp. NPDC055357]